MAENGLIESELRYRTVFEEALNPIMMVNGHGHCLEANQATLSYLECSLDELRRRKVWDWAPPEALKQVEQQYSPLSGRRTVQTDCLANGRGKTIMLNLVPVELAGQPVIYGIGQDITDKKHAEEALREQSDFLQALMEAIPGATFHKNTEHVYLSCNEAFAQFMGVPKEKIVGKSVYDIAPKGLADIYRRRMRSCSVTPAGRCTRPKSILLAAGCGM